MTDAEHLLAFGPIVEVVCRTTEPGADRATSAPFLVDTGADVTVIALSVADELGLAEVGEGLLAGVTDGQGGMRCPVFRVRLDVPGGGIHDIEAVGLPREDPSAPLGFIGRDVLASLRFTYDGPAGAFALEVG